MVSLRRLTLFVLTATLLVGGCVGIFQAILLPYTAEAVFGHNTWELAFGLESCNVPQLSFSIDASANPNHQGMDWHWGGSINRQRRVWEDIAFLPSIRISHSPGSFWNCGLRVNMPYLLIVLLGIAVGCLYRYLKRWRIGGFVIKSNEK
jgi:hypothetical protein